MVTSRLFGQEMLLLRIALQTFAKRLQKIDGLLRHVDTIVSKLPVSVLKFYDTKRF